MQKMISLLPLVEYRVNEPMKSVYRCRGPQLQPTFLNLESPSQRTSEAIALAQQPKLQSKPERPLMRLRPPGQHRLNPSPALASKHSRGQARNYRGRHL